MLSEGYVIEKKIMFKSTSTSKNTIIMKLTLSLLIGVFPFSQDISHPPYVGLGPYPYLFIANATTIAEMYAAIGRGGLTRIPSKTFMTIRCTSETNAISIYNLYYNTLDVIYFDSYSMVAWNWMYSLDGVHLGNWNPDRDSVCKVLDSGIGLCTGKDLSNFE